MLKILPLTACLKTVRFQYCLSFFKKEKAAQTAAVPNESLTLARKLVWRHTWTSQIYNNNWRSGRERNMRLNRYTVSRIKSANFIGCSHFTISLFLNFNDCEIEKDIWASITVSQYISNHCLICCLRLMLFSFESYIRIIDYS